MKLYIMCDLGPTTLYIKLHYALPVCDAVLLRQSGERLQ